jgi:hypothetical protein
MSAATNPGGFVSSSGVGDVLTAVNVQAAAVAALTVTIATARYAAVERVEIAITGG